MFSLSKNIIAQAEFKHQRYILENNRSNTLAIVLAVLMLAPGALLSLGAFLLALFNVYVGDWALVEALESMPVLLVALASNVVMNIALYFVLMLIALGLAYNSISREKTGRTWDILRLTNVDARTVVWGKWWASLLALWGDHLMIVVLRVGLACVVVLYAPDGVGGLVVVLAIALIVAAFTFVDVAFTVSLAIASSLSGTASPVTGLVVLAVRFAGIFAVIAVYFWMILLILRGDVTAFCVVGLMLTLVFGLLTWVTLSLARVLAVRGALVSPAIAPPPAPMPGLAIGQTAD